MPGDCIDIVSHLPSLDAEQRSILDHWSGATLVIGPPGAGKTTMLASAMVRLSRADGPPPVLFAGSRTAASELRNQVVAELGDGTWQPLVTTVHAFCRSLWQAHSLRPELRLLSAPEQEFRVRELLAGSGQGAWPQEILPALGTRGFARQVRAALARARQLGLDPEDLIAFGEVGGRPEWIALGGFFNEYLDVLDAEGVLDYAELVHRVRLLSAEPDVSAQLQAQFGGLLVDDYTELDPAQIDLIAQLAGNSAVLAAADPHSVSSTFRGAAPRAVADFEQVFGAAGRRAQVVELSRSHRLSTPLVAALAGVRAKLPQLPGLGSALTPCAGSAEVTALVCAGEAEQASAIADELRRARLEDGLAYGDMAVLVRSGRRQLGPIIRSLVAAGVPVEVAGDEIPLAQAPAVRPLLLALQVAVQPNISPDEAMRLLTSPMAGFDVLGLRRLSRQWRRAGVEVPVTLAEQLAAALNAPEWLQSAEPSPEVERFGRLYGLLEGARSRLVEQAPVDQVAWTLWQDSGWPEQLQAESVAGGALGSRADADLDALCAFFAAAAEADRRGGVAGVRAFLAELATQQIPADHEREARLRRRGVQVLTVHRARGKEWDLVVVAGVQEGQWPTGRGLSTVLDAAQLTQQGLVGGTDHREALAAERRLFHLAASRARRRLVVTATAGTEGEADAPSRFLAELGLAAHAPANQVALTLPGLVAELRRAAADPVTPPALRAGAIAELGRLARAQDDSGRSLVPAADPERWWGVREVSGQPQALPPGARIRLSPSQVSSVLTCPRRYFLAREARGEADPGLAASLGSLIHLLVQQAVTQGWGLDELRGELDQVWDRLRFETAWLSATERVEVELGLARFLAWREARRAELVGVEVPFTLSLPVDEWTAVLDGKVDWLERDARGLQVIDFKTSRTAPTKAAIAGLEQLGVYQLAVAAGGFAQFGGEARPSGAAAVYLRLPGRPESLPKEFEQESIDRVPHLDQSSQEYPTWVHQRVAQATRVVAAGRFPANPGSQCRFCAFAVSCPASGSGEQVLP